MSMAVQRLTESPYQQSFGRLSEFIEYLPSLRMEATVGSSSCFYLVLDNFHNLDPTKHTKFIANLLNLKSLSNNLMQVIIIQNSIKDWQYVYSALNKYQQVTVPHQAQEVVHQVVRNTLLFRYSLEGLSDEVGEVLLDIYVNDICDVFRGHTRSIKVIKQVAVQLFFLVLETVL